MIYFNTLSERSLMSLKSCLRGETGLTQLLECNLALDDVAALALIPEIDVEIEDITAARPGYEVSLESAITALQDKIAESCDIIIHDLWASLSDVQPELRDMAEIIPAEHGVYFRVSGTEKAINVEKKLVSYLYSVFFIESHSAAIVESKSFVSDFVRCALIRAFDGSSYFIWRNPRIIHR